VDETTEVLVNAVPVEVVLEARPVVELAEDVEEVVEGAGKTP